MIEIKIDTTGIKDIDRDGGVTVEELGYIASQAHVLESCGTINENDGIEKE